MAIKFPAPSRADGVTETTHKTEQSSSKLFWFSLFHFSDMKPGRIQPWTLQLAVEEEEPNQGTLCHIYIVSSWGSEIQRGGGVRRAGMAGGMTQRRGSQQGFEEEVRSMWAGEKG